MIYEIKQISSLIHTYQANHRSLKETTVTAGIPYRTNTIHILEA